MICSAVGDSVDRLWDVLVVGAGVAGAMAAWGAAREGKSVLLLDKAHFPRGKACGCCLNHTAVTILDQAKFNFRRLGAIPLDHLDLSCAGTRASLPIPGGLAVGRDVLDTALVEHAVNAGAIFLPGAIVEDTQLHGACRWVRVLEDGLPMQVRAKIILVADGLAGRLLRAENSARVASDSRIGVAGTAEYSGSDYAPGTIYMACAKDGYVGLVRLDGNKIHLAAALQSHGVKKSRGTAAAVAEIIRAAGLTVPQGLATCRWYGAPALTRHRSRVAEERLFILGDAAGYVEPFSGEGMAWALAAARDVIPLVVRASQKWSYDLADQWQRRQRDVMESRHRVCRAMTLMLRHQGVTHWAVRALQIAPGLARPLMRFINRPIVN